jgi:hypothetical protein
MNVQSLATHTAVLFFISSFLFFVWYWVSPWGCCLFMFPSRSCFTFDDAHIKKLIHLTGKTLTVGFERYAHLKSIHIHSRIRSPRSDYHDTQTVHSKLIPTRVKQFSSSTTIYLKNELSLIVHDCFRWLYLRFIWILVVFLIPSLSSSIVSVFMSVLCWEIAIIS